MTIEVGTTTNMSCTGAPVVCTPTGPGAILSIHDLKKLLARSSVTVNTGSGGTAAGDITVSGMLAWSASNPLTLDAYRSILVNKPVNVQGSGTSAGLTLTTNDGGSDGALSFGSGGYVNFWDIASTLIVNGTTYTLVNSVNSNTNTLSVLVSDIDSNLNQGNYALGASYNAGADGTYTGAVVQAYPFTGRFEGLGNVISYLSTTTDAQYGGGGLFQKLQGSVSNVGLAHVNITGSTAVDGVGIAVGALVSQAASGATLSGDWVSGTINIKSSRTSCANIAAGGMVGAATGLAISNSHSSAKITVNNQTNIKSRRCHGDGGGTSVGGLVEIDVGGTSAPSIRNSYATGDIAVKAPVDGVVSVGGLAGGAENVSNSYATGSISITGGALYIIAGGLVGTNQGTISSSFATSNVSANGGGDDNNTTLIAGGLVGRDDGNGSDVSIYQSFATGNVTTNASNTVCCYGAGAVAGGLVGYDNDGIHQDVYAMGAVSAFSSAKDTSLGASDAGGLVGFFDFGSIDQAYSTGFVQATSSNENGVYAGGFLGQTASPCSPCTITNSYWDTDTSGQLQGTGDGSSFAGLSGLTTAQFQSGLPTGFDSNIWSENGTINNDFPYLISNPPRD